MGFDSHGYSFAVVEICTLNCRGCLPYASQASLAAIGPAEQVLEVVLVALVLSDDVVVMQLVPDTQFVPASRTKLMGVDMIEPQDGWGG